MAEYLHPGVYIEEQPVPQTIEGVSTSTAGFVGVSAKGPTTGPPQMVTSLNDFVRRYGAHLPEDPWRDARHLAYAVEGFFANGGQRVFITRIVGADAAPATRTLNAGFATRLAVDTASDDAQRTSARLVSLRGIEEGMRVTFEEVIGGSARSSTREVASYDGATGTVTFEPALDARFTADGAIVTLDGVPAAPAPAGGTPSLRVSASSPGSWGRELSLQVSDSQGTSGLTDAFAEAARGQLSAAALAFAGDGPGAGEGPAAGATSAALADAGSLRDGDVVEFDDGDAATPNEQRTVTVDGATIRWGEGLVRGYVSGASVRRLTVLRAGAENPLIELADVSGFEPGLVRITQGATSEVLQVGAVDGAANTLTFDTSTYAVRTSFTAGATLVRASAVADGTRLNLRSARNLYPGAYLEVDDGTRKSHHTVETIAGNVLTMTAPIGREVPGGVAVRVLEFDLSVSDGDLSERFDHLSVHRDAPNFVESVVNPRSDLIRVEALGAAGTPPFNLPQTDTGAAVPLAGGNDGAVPGPDQYIGSDDGPGRRSGIRALADIDEISLLAAPGVSHAAVQAELIVQCETLKNRFAVLDPQRGSRVGSGRDDDVIVQRHQHDSTYAAMYYPWLRLHDPLYPERRGGSLVPPSGHVLGVYARVDTERGVHKAPANEVLRGITGLEVKLGDRDQDRLNPINLNVIRDFRGSGRGIRVWGARVLTSDSGWRYVPVRRMFIFLERSMDVGLQWVVFEPNGEDLWARVRQTLVDFLRTVWLGGALAGVTEDEAFFVRCDRTTMTETDIASGRLIVLVGVAPLRPAEFVIIRIGQKTLEPAVAA